MSSFRTSQISSPEWHLTRARMNSGSNKPPRARMNSGSNKPSSGVRACKFGSLCVKFGCPFVHPPSRPQDCPDGEFCDEVKCPLHHPKSRPIIQYKPPQRPKNNYPSLLLFAGVGTSISQGRSPMPRRLSARSPCCLPVRTPRYSNRKISRSPMAVPSPNNRPTTGYFAATTKPCIRGAACVKYGCTYKHPAARAVDCPAGIGCNDGSCARLHPVNEYGTGAIDAGFAIGQKVLAKFLPNSAKWSHATIRSIRGSALTLQFDGFADAIKIPLRRVRCCANEQCTPVCPTSPPTSPPPSPPPSPPSPSPLSLRNVEELQRLKQAAVIREDFIAAAQIKHRIATVEKIIHLEQRKQKAVRDEDFLMAMDLKKQIAMLESANQPPERDAVNSYK